MKTFRVLTVLMLAMVLTLGACVNTLSLEVASAAPAAGVKTIKVANFYGSDHAENMALREVFKPMVEEKTGGSLVVEIYDNGQLGSEEQFFNAMRAGMVEMCINGTIMADEVPSIGICQVPFLFDNYSEARKVLTSEIGEKMHEGFEETLGMRFLAYGVNGFRVFSSKNPIRSIDDFKGLKLRMASGYPELIKIGEALQCNTIPLTFAEIFTSLEQGVVESQENPYSVVRANGFFEVQNYMLESNHVFSINAYSMNLNFWNNLTAEEQSVVAEAAQAAADRSWELNQKAVDEDKKFLEENGMEIIYPDDAFKQAMREAVQPVYDWYFGENPWAVDMVEDIRTLLGR